MAEKSSVIDTNGGVSSETDYQYDLDGNVTQVSSPQGVIHYAYDPVTDLETEMLTNGTQVDYPYDPPGQLLTLTQVKLNGQVLADPIITAYTYDALGDVITQVTTQNSVTLTSTTNTYDPQTHWLASVVNQGGCDASRPRRQIAPVTTTAAAAAHMIRYSRLGIRVHPLVYSHI